MYEQTENVADDNQMHGKAKDIEIAALHHTVHPSSNRLESMQYACGATHIHNQCFISDRKRSVPLEKESKSGNHPQVHSTWQPMLAGIVVRSLRRTMHFALAC